MKVLTLLNIIVVVCEYRDWSPLDIAMIAGCDERPNVLILTSTL